MLKKFMEMVEIADVMVFDYEAEYDVFVPCKASKKVLQLIEWLKASALKIEEDEFINTYDFDGFVVEVHCADID